MKEIKIRYDALPLPEGVNGLMQEDAENLYIIALNENATPEQQAATFLHECLHIFHQDTRSKRGAGEIERDRHKELISILNLLCNEQQ